MANFKKKNYDNKIIEKNVPAGTWGDKYHSTNILNVLVLDNWIKNIREAILCVSDQIQTVTDIGCGEGHITSIIAETIDLPMKAYDVSEQIIEVAKKNFPNHNIDFCQKNIYDLTSEDQADLVICLEVLEHLTDPKEGLSSLAKITQKYCILSVPNEPTFRILNFLRGRYMKDCGASPGHLQFWSTKSFCRLVSEYFVVKKITTPLPWTVLLCEKINS